MHMSSVDSHLREMEVESR